MIIRSKAPLRISFGGGGTDVSPYIEERGGAVINATIDKYAYVSLFPHDGNTVKVKSLDYKIDISFNGGGEELKYDGELDLVKAAVKVLKIKQGFDSLLHTDAPPGAGLGSSSTMTTALVGAFSQWQRLPLSEYEIAELACRIEREELGLRGGKQDQYACAFGGINFIEFFADRTIVNPLRIKQDVLNELEYRLILCYTGRSRLSSEIIMDQVARYSDKQEDIVYALDQTKDIATAMKNAFLLGHIDEMGQLLGEGWLQKKKFSHRITDPFIDELYETAKKSGAVGGKLLGAGGGGHLLMLCQPTKKHQVTTALQKAGATITPFAFESHGLQSWKVN